MSAIIIINYYIYNTLSPSSAFGPSPKRRSSINTPPGRIRLLISGGFRFLKVDISNAVFNFFLPAAYYK